MTAFFMGIAVVTSNLAYLVAVLWFLKKFILWNSNFQSRKISKDNGMSKQWSESVNSATVHSTCQVTSLGLRDMIANCWLVVIGRRELASILQFHSETPALELPDGICYLLTGAVHIGGIQVVRHSGDLRGGSKVVNSELCKGGAWRIHSSLVQTPPLTIGS